MFKKSLFFGLLVALVASTVVGAFGVADAQAYYNNNQYASLACSPSVQYATSGQLVNFTASYNGGTYNNYYPYGNLTWSAVGGSPSTGTGSTFSTRFYTTSVNQTSVVTVTDGHSTVSCTVYVNGYNYTPTPYPYPTYSPYPTPYSAVYCTPSYANATSGQAIYASAWGGNGSYSWTATDGIPTYGTGSNFTTTFSNYGTWPVTKYLTVYSNGSSATCTVSVAGTNYYTPTPTPYSYGYVTLDNSVRNVTTGQAGTGVVANNGDRLQFTATVSTNGSQYATNVRIQDVLPAYVGYVPGTTRVNGSSYSDAITGGGLSLGTLQSNRTYTIIFDAQVLYNPYSTQTLVNTVNLWSDNAAMQTRTTRVYVNGHGYGNPTPTPTPYVIGGSSNGAMTLTVDGRNVSRGQTGGFTTVGVRGNDTVDILVHVRSTSGQYLSNVLVTDYLPSGLNYVYGSTTLNGVVTGDGITSSGLNIGSLAPGQEVIVKFSATADTTLVPSYGVVTTTDTAQARADGVGTVSAQLNINLGNESALAMIGNVKTGPADALLIALALAALITGFYAMYTRTDAFGRRMSVTEIARMAGRSMNFSR